MTIDQALQRLRQLIYRSAGAAIALPSGVEHTFRQKRTFEERDVAEVERSLGLSFPAEYRELLTTIGAADCYIDENGWAAVQVYDPSEVPPLYADFFENPDDLRVTFPVACDNRLQEIVVLLLDRAGPHNVLVVSHETVPEDWLDDAEERGCTSLEEWLVEALTSDGRLKPH